MVRPLRLLLIVAALLTSAPAVWGQQPKRKPEPYVAPFLPAQTRWSIALPARPAAGGVMDSANVYIPLQAPASPATEVATPAPGAPAMPTTPAIVALDRQSGLLRWSHALESATPPVAAGTVVLVAGPGEVRALSAMTGALEWSVPLDSTVRAPMFLRGNLLIALTEPDVLVGMRVDTKEIAWRRPVGETGAVLMNADDRAIYLTTTAGRVVCVQLADGSIRWERKLPGSLSEPALGRDRVFIGSDTNAFWAIDPETGADEWRWDARLLGGDVIGAAVEDDIVYMASLDNIIRALNRGNGNQRWKAEAGTRPVLPPRAYFGTVIVTGLAPTLLSTFHGTTGKPVSSWTAPADAELQGPPLVDEHLKPFGVAIVVITRDGRVIGLRPTAMAFEQPAAGTLTELPGRVLPIERLPGQPVPTPTSPPSAR